MSTYSIPGVYTETVNNANSSIIADTTVVCGFVGLALKGVCNTPVLITSWQNYLDKFAYGLDTPFMQNSDLSYSVYGFFQNGGSKCYVTRLNPSSGEDTFCLTCATAGTSELGNVKITANSEGAWGNDISYSVAVGSTASTFKLVIKYKGNVVETYDNVTNTVNSSSYWVDAIALSKYVTGEGTLITTPTDKSLAGGSDDIGEAEDLDESFATEVKNMVDTYGKEMTFIAVPGQTSANINASMLTITRDSGVFAILDAPKATTVDLEISNKKALTGSLDSLIMFSSWIRISDPLSATGKLRDCPACGHIMGVYARIMQNRGIWKAPAGTEAVIQGAVELVLNLKDYEIGQLNDAQINSLVCKPNYGIVIWGARSCSADYTMRYVSDVVLQNYIKKALQNGTEWAVFEPNNALLWSKVATSVETFLDGLWRQGGLHGDSAPQAYFVKCDSELNNEETRNEGKLICDVGYAPNKPAEFVVIRIAHSVNE